jgi:guanylate kinase
MEHIPIVITGPSGTGKTKLIEYITNRNIEYTEAVGVTTRERRKTDRNINFTTKENFVKLINEHRLIEYTIYNGNYYGMPINELDKLKRQSVIFDVGYSSAKLVKMTYNKTKMIYMLPPSEEELIKRLKKENRDINRFVLGKNETLKNSQYYDYLLISDTDNMEAIYQNFINIVEKNEKTDIDKKEKFIEDFYR